MIKRLIKKWGEIESMQMVNKWFHFWGFSFSES
jgi:hypothetical protein